MLLKFKLNSMIMGQSKALTRILNFATVLPKTFYFLCYLKLVHCHLEVVPSYPILRLHVQIKVLVLLLLNP